MLVLGIESSCDETGAAIVRDDGEVLSDVVQSQASAHAAYGGVVPELASRDHLRNVRRVVTLALTRAEVTFADVSAVAVTHRPGLVGALLVGVSAAKGIAWAAGKPLVGVDHLMGHLLSVFLRRGDLPSTGVPEFPYVCLLASGGHTALYRVDAPSADSIRELGATRDDAAGEAFDKVGKLLGLGYPGGPAIDRLAERGKADKVTLSSPMAQARSLEFSFSGLKTQLVQRVAREGVPHGEALADLCAAFQSVVVGTLARKLDLAAVRENVKHVVLGGGVAANRGLRARVTELAAAHGYTAHLPPLASCTDNAAMIAYAGAVRAARGERDGLDLVATSATVLPRVTRKGRGERTGPSSLPPKGATRKAN
jgi:N6-L-threonylcarbamoyladenine synthase